jgi:phosphoglycolate phosphatase
LENKKLKTRGILLDLDGTVVDAREAYFEAARTAFAALRQRMADIKTMIEIPKRLEQNLPIDDLLTGIDVKKFREIYLKAYYDATAVKTRPFPNIAETLKKLSEKAKLALTTRRSVSSEEVIAELKRFDLARYFQNVVTSRDTKNPKPSPEALIKCSEQLGVNIQDCIVVGDSVVDIRAGKNAGARTVAVLSGIFSREELKWEKPDLILENINELPDFLD